MYQIMLRIQQRFILIANLKTYSFKNLFLLYLTFKQPLFQVFIAIGCVGAIFKREKKIIFLQSLLTLLIYKIFQSIKNLRLKKNMSRSRMDQELNLFEESSILQDPLDIPYVQQHSEDFQFFYDQESSQVFSKSVKDKESKEQITEKSQSEEDQPKRDQQVISKTHDEDQEQKTFRNNPRRKLEERKVLEALIYLASKFSSQKSKKKPEINFSKITKNILAFAKKPHLDFIKDMMGINFIKNVPFLQAIYKKKSINLDDYRNMYTFQPLNEVLGQFFSKKILFRYLMISRTIQKDKIYYLYFLDAFERNFYQKKFESLSCPKVQIELEKINLLKKRQNNLKR